MKVTTLQVRNFRNHNDSRLEFGPAMNVLLGGNGQGKTNIVEALSYIGLTKSFFSISDSVALQFGKDAFEIRGIVAEDSGRSNSVAIQFDRTAGIKEIAVNRVTLEKLHLLVGRFPVVVLSPESARMTFGPPAERRKFLDLVLSQESRAYLEDLLEYRQVLKQRNTLLAEAKITGRMDDNAITPWSKSLVRLGSRIVLRRKGFVSNFRERLSAVYRMLAGCSEEVDGRYDTRPEPGADLASIAGGLTQEIERMRSEEMRRGVSLVGPHRDDLVMTINGNDIQSYASQGQHKTVLLAMKIAEFEYLKATRNEIPILLLDDLFSELDAERSERIIGVVSALGQSVITTTSDSMFRQSVSWSDKHRRFLVESGTCRPC
jgi:DNA replication and repair protein RecF